MDKIVLTLESDMPKTRAMTRKQVREFNAKGLNPQKEIKIINLVKKTREGELNSEELIEFQGYNETMTEWILENVYYDYDFDNADQKATDTLAAETYTKTFVSGVETKNS